MPERMVKVSAIIESITKGHELPGAIKVLFPILNLPEEIPEEMVREMAWSLLSLTSGLDQGSGPSPDRSVVRPVERLEAPVEAITPGTS